MKVYLDTSTPETILRLDEHEYRKTLDHDLAEKLLGWMKEKLSEHEIYLLDRKIDKILSVIIKYNF